MAQIGEFKLKDGTWSGTIRTLTINIKARLVPNKDESKTKDQPDFRLLAGRTELGVAWRQESKAGETPFLSVRLDDPGFAQPVRAAFFWNEEDGTGVLVWKRNK